MLCKNLLKLDDLRLNLLELGYLVEIFLKVPLYQEPCEIKKARNSLWFESRA